MANELFSHSQRGKKRKDKCLSFKNIFIFFKLCRNEHVNITNFQNFCDFSFFSRTFPGLEKTVLKLHGFFRFSMTVRTLKKAFFREQVKSSRRAAVLEVNKDAKLSPQVSQLQSVIYKPKPVCIKVVTPPSEVSF